MTREARTVDEFIAVVPLDPSKKYHFKFVVDGVWRCSGEVGTSLEILFLHIFIFSEFQILL
jgi:hypothetical protein